MGHTNDTLSVLRRRALSEEDLVREVEQDALWSRRQAWADLVGRLARDVALSTARERVKHGPYRRRRPTPGRGELLRQLWAECGMSQQRTQMRLSIDTTDHAEASDWGMIQ